MKFLKESHVWVSTILAFAIIPLSGFATDVYLPSFPAMADFFGTGKGDIQLSLVVFVVSNGVAQLFVGSLLDSFGRYRLSLAALIVFALSCFVIATTSSLVILLSMRVIQGLAVALIVVAKRALFVDVYSGKQLKHYTSLFSIIWATAPIAAPFIGGFLHYYFGWQSNFYFLGIAIGILLVLELIYGGETLKIPHPFKIRSMASAYASKLSTSDFTLSLFILGSSFSMVIMFNMVSPFIIEQVFHESAVTTGNCALLSGIAIMAGGLASKSMIHRPLLQKIRIAGPLLVVMSSLMIILMSYLPGLITTMVMVMLLHAVGGFTFNTFYTHALGRFTTNAAITSGITGGATYIITSVFSYAIVRILHVQNLVMLGTAYFIHAIVLAVLFILFIQSQRAVLVKKEVVGAVS